MSFAGVGASWRPLAAFAKEVCIWYITNRKSKTNNILREKNMSELIAITEYPVAPVLKLLLKDKTTGKNIIWATDTYANLGDGLKDRQQISEATLLLHPDLIKPRIAKSQEDQQSRTRKKAEVFTPVWLCNEMNSYCDEDWFGRKNVFNIENSDHTWDVVQDKIEFPKGKTWKSYVDSRRLEITCGEAPFLVSRYDAATGNLIEPPKRRIGILDRKLRIVDENTESYEDWLKWTVRAFEAVYGYEYQGDNLLIARVNLLMTFVDYYRYRWGKDPDVKLLRTLANKIAWNIWQMDGLSDTVPMGRPYEEYHQMSLFEDAEEKTEEAAPCCKIYNWRRGNSLLFKKLKEK